MDTAAIPHGASPPEAKRNPATSNPDELAELRRLLLGGDLETILQDAQPALEAQAVSEVLAEAIAQSHAQSQKQLTQAAVPTVETAIQTSVETNINILSEALFPIIGPATRKSVAAAIRNLTQSLNQGLEHSLSPQSFKWRWEARRTGRSFAEVVLLRTLVYQVEQVLLIHKETGLLLQQVVSEQTQSQDPDLVSAMLTAIQDFVQDSFNVQSGGSLDTLEVGEMNIWIEAGPQAVLACVIRGTAPQELRGQLQTTLEQIHRAYAAPLKGFEGDQAPFKSSQTYLQDCLKAQFKTQGNGEKQRPTKLLMALGCLNLLLGAWLGLQIQTGHRWQNYVSQLEQEPGLVVIQQQRQGGKFKLSGLQDPLARSPEALLAQTKLQPEQVTMQWEPYLSLDQAFTLKRWQTRLAPPDGVTLRLDANQVLHISGTAPEAWISLSQRLLHRGEGLQDWNTEGLISQDRQQLLALKDRIEQRSILFLPGSSKIEPSQQGTLQAQQQDLAEFLQTAQAIDLAVYITLAGYSDPTGNDQENHKLSQARATAVEQALVQPGIPAQAIATQARGVSSSPTSADLPSAARRVSITIEAPQLQIVPSPAS